jgi:hypothetical protein
MGRDRKDIDSAKRWRTEAVDTAEAVIAGRVGLVEGVRSLTGIGHRMLHDFWGDPDFSVLGAVASETDELPVGHVRASWDPAALVAKDRERAEYESQVREAVLAACQAIRTRYGAG